MTPRVFNFSPGPGVLPLSVLQEAQRDLLSLPGIGISPLEISHRSPWFDGVLNEAEANLRRLLAIPGVRDAVVFQPSDAEAQAQGVGRIQRVAAAVVAPGMSAPDILGVMAQAVDPVFLPRPLLLLAELPRNELGKISRTQLLQLLQHAAG